MTSTPLPVRIQRSRRKGFNLQAHSRAINGLDAVNVTRPTVFGNPWVAKSAGQGRPDLSNPENAYYKSKVRCVRRYEDMINGIYPNDKFQEEYEKERQAILRNLPRLRGKNLACYCPLYAPCHADVLLRLAREMVCEEVQPPAFEGGV